MDRLDLEDALAELQHDLGKYLRLPLAWLPADADAAAVRGAARQALLETRRAAGVAQPAGRIWAGFCEEVGDALGGAAGWPALCSAVERALAWTSQLDGPLDRAALTADLEAVTPAIRSLLEEVRHG